MLRIGLTGGIGSGKSTASRLFESLGAPIIDADEIAREVVAPGMPALKAILHDFGADLSTQNGQLDRRKLRERVFAEPSSRERLEALLYPLIRREMRLRASRSCAPYCILVIPLLIEKGWESEVERILVIDTSRERQIERAQQRDGLSREQVEQVLATQATREQRLAKANDVITNDGDINRLRDQVTMAHHRYIVLAQKN